MKMNVIKVADKKVESDADNMDALRLSKEVNLSMKNCAQGKANANERSDAQKMRQF